MRNQMPKDWIGNVKLWSPQLLRNL